MNRHIKIALLTVVAAVAAQCQQATVPPGEIRGIVEKAYTFAYPLVLMELTRRNTVEHATLGGDAYSNRFTHAPEFPNATFRQVIRPNADTLYSSAWLDISQEPMLLQVPDTKGRYYLVQLMDGWTETFASPGKRTTGTGEGWFAIVGPGWKGKLPERAQRIDSPTNMVWLLGRTQTNNVSDYENVHAIQKGFHLMPLSLYPDGQRPLPPQAPRPASNSARITPPLQVQQMSGVEFFRTFAQLLAKNPPHSDDQPMMQELARIGIVPGKPFLADSLGGVGVKALEDGARAAADRLAALDGRVGRAGKNGWSGGGGKVGRYGTDYAARAATARIGLGALPPEDATYKHCHQDSEGRALDGSHQYRMPFEKSEIPPVRAFWSVTMYSEDGYFVPNAINRFAIGDRDPLKFNADGSLDLYIQKDSPGGAKDSNWLPAPEGEFNLSLRLYWPSEEILTGRWNPPAVLRTDLLIH